MWHFAHHPPHPNCGNETWLHWIAVRMLHARLSRALSENVGVRLSYSCDCLCGKHGGNVARVADSVVMERRIESGTIRPDVRLCRNAQTVALFEVVVTHEPALAVVEWAQSNQIPILEFHLKEPADLNKLQQEVLVPDRVNGLDKQTLCPCSSRPCDCGRPGCPQHTHCPPPCQIIDSPDHRHCRQCGHAVSGHWAYCFCCSLARRLERIPCYRRGLSPYDGHRHCKTCHTEMMGHNTMLYDDCYGCNQRRIQSEQNLAIAKKESLHENLARRQDPKLTPADVERRQLWAALNAWLQPSIERYSNGTNGTGTGSE